MQKAHLHCYTTEPQTWQLKRFVQMNHLCAQISILCTQMTVLLSSNASFCVQMLTFALKMLIKCQIVVTKYKIVATWCQFTCKKAICCHKWLILRDFFFNVMSMSPYFSYSLWSTNSSRISTCLRRAPSYWFYQMKLLNVWIVLTT